MNDQQRIIRWGPARMNHAIHAMAPMATAEVLGQAIDAKLGRPEREHPSVWTLRDRTTGAHVKVWSSAGVDADVWFVAWTDGPKLPGSGRELATRLIEGAGGALIGL